MTFRIAWATDIHLDHASEEWRSDFVESIEVAAPDLLLVTGDITTADRLAAHLAELRAAVPRFAFVLGNHDYWGSSIRAVRERMAADDSGWLGASPTIELTPRACLVGVDGWYDCRAGHGAAADGVALNDWWHIEEFARRGWRTVHQVARELADQDTAALRPRLHQAAARFPQVYVATHVPPMEAASLYHGTLGPDESRGYFTNVGLGEALLEIAAAHPAVSFTVLCGHTHEECQLPAAPNLEVRVGAADYRFPEISDVFDVR
jgi:predicted phosphohydrolase